MAARRESARVSRDRVVGDGGDGGVDNDDDDVAVVRLPDVKLNSVRATLARGESVRAKVNKHSMSAVLGGGVGGETAPASALLDSDVESILEEKNQLISRQYAEIERLQRELAEIVGERDALLCEVSKFKFEREMTDLKRLHDDRYAFFLLTLYRFSFRSCRTEDRNEESHFTYTLT